MKISIYKSIKNALESLDAYDKWEANVLKENPGSEIEVYDTDLIPEFGFFQFLKQSFSWRKSPEGFDYWNEVARNGFYLPLINHPYIIKLREIGALEKFIRDIFALRKSKPRANISDIRSFGPEEYSFMMEVVHKPTFYDFIDRAFTWSETAEGNAFWIDVANTTFP